MDDIVKHIPLTIPESNPDYFKGKLQALLAYIGVKWYFNKINTKLPPFKNTLFRYLQQEKEDIIEANLIKSNYNCN